MTPDETPYTPSKLKITEDDETAFELKKEINNLIWMYGPGSLTLEKAEGLACNILASIQEGHLIKDY